MRGLTQAELAGRAGVSRQLISAVESGRNLPRVDSALALAEALGVEVTDLFLDAAPPVDALSGMPPSEGATLRIGSVSGRTVTAESRIGIDGYDIADGVYANGELEHFGSTPPGAVVVGCEPGLELLERILREAGRGGFAVMASSRKAVEVLEAGRAHAAVVHHDVDGPTVPALRPGTVQIGLAKWRVGLAAPPGSRPGWADEALSGTVPVVQRESGAGVQATFQASLRSDSPLPAGPIASTHLEAARRAIWSGMAAVTIEPAAIALGAEFHALGTHEAVIWLGAATSSDPVVDVALDIVNDARFQRRLSAVGGYDLSSIGTRAA